MGDCGRLKCGHVSWPPPSIPCGWHVQLAGHSGLGSLGYSLTEVDTVTPVYMMSMFIHIPLLELGGPFWGICRVQKTEGADSSPWQPYRPQPSFHLSSRIPWSTSKGPKI